MACEDHRPLYFLECGDKFNETMDNCWSSGDERMGSFVQKILLHIEDE